MPENKNDNLVLPDEIIMNKIYLIRDCKVMIDKDLAELYSVETRVLKQQVKRNIERFPNDFMFELTIDEFTNLRSQIVTSNWGGARYVPMVFTEQGVAMLSSVLRSKQAKAVFTSAGRIVPFNNNGIIVYKFEYILQDHLGNTRVVFSGHSNGLPEVMQVTDYYPFGLVMNQQNYFSDGVLSNKYLYNGKELQDDELAGNSLGWYDYGARFYDAELGRWHSVDPLAHLREWVSPYNFVQNNPLNRIDPTGALDNPIYDENGNFLGTDDLGIQGEAIIMNKNDFKQGMSHEDALSKGTLRSDLPMVYSQSFFDKIDNHHSNLTSRPDWDGHLTLEEANEWYRTGEGQPLFTDFSKIDLSGIYSLGEKYVGQVKTVNLLLNSGSLNDGLVYGNIALKRYPNHQVRAFSDRYDFEMHNPRNPLNWGRNAETVIGRKFAREGTPFEINIHGSATLKPLFPWTK